MFSEVVSLLLLSLLYCIFVFLSILFLYIFYTGSFVYLGDYRNIHFTNNLLKSLDTNNMYDDFKNSKKGRVSSETLPVIMHILTDVPAFPFFLFSCLQGSDFINI